MRRVYPFVVVTEFLENGFVFGIQGAPWGSVRMEGTGSVGVYRIRVTQVYLSQDTPVGRRSVEALSS